LIQSGADVNVRSKENWTALSMASSQVRYSFTCHRQYIDIMLRLLCVGARIDKIALEQDKDCVGLLSRVQTRLNLLQNGDDGDGGVIFYSNEDRYFLYELAFSLVKTGKLGALSFKVYRVVRSFITFHDIFMAPGYSLGYDHLLKDLGKADTSEKT